jgi:hydroxypyruvate isomerase
MPRFAANLSMLFTELPFLERFAAARAAGFRGVEFLFPYDWPADVVAEAAGRAGVEVVLFNLPPGDWAASERGLAALPGREAEFTRSVGEALDYARALGCARLHAMAGVGAGDAATYAANLRLAAGSLAADGITLLIEPINRRDMPGYHLADLATARAVLAEVAAPNLRLQADLYHLQIVGGDLSVRLTEAFSEIGHVQVAGVPERHEPDSGELACAHLFALLDRLGYAGWIGCEYRPRAGTVAGLGWLKPWL